MILSAQDTVFLQIESRDTPMHVGALMEFTLPEDAAPDHVEREVERLRAAIDLAPPWSRQLVTAPVVGARLPLMREVRDVDLEYHVRHSALPGPGGQRELGTLIARLHTHQLDLRRPLWEVHLIEGLAENRFALYVKLHHSIVDGATAVRLLAAGLSTDPAARDQPPFWSVTPPSSPRPARAAPGPLARLAGAVKATVDTGTGVGRLSFDYARAAVDPGELTAPFRGPASMLGGPVTGARRLATQQYSLAHLKALAAAADCTLNDIVLYLCSSAIRRYLLDHDALPSRSLTVGFPANIREPGDDRPGTVIGLLIAELATDVPDPQERLAAIIRSTAAAKRHLRGLPAAARAQQSIVVNGPWFGGMALGWGGLVPASCNVLVSNVVGPPEPLFLNGARMDALYPVSLVAHGTALNITCVSYADTLNFGLIGARDSLPHLQHMALYMGEALAELEELGAGAPAVS